MDDLTVLALDSIIKKQIKQREDAIIKELTYGCKETGGRDEIYGRMLYNSMAVSVRLSVGFILDILLSCGIVEAVDEKQLRKTILSTIKEQDP